MTDQYAIANYVEALESEQVKALVLNWLSITDGSLSDFERLLESEFRSHDTVLEYGQIDETLAFQSMSDSHKIESSLQVLEEYKQTGNGTAHERVREWLDSLGTDQPRSCPK